MAEQPTLVLLHGLGANRHVWDGVAELWSGEVFAPDLRGHGAAPWFDRYSFGAMAADVAEVLADEHGDAPYFVVGHSMGGIVGLALASGWFGPTPTTAATIGVKLRWTDAEVARIPELAERPPRQFSDRDSAVEWFLKLSGLFGVVAADDERISNAIEAGTMRTDAEVRYTTDGEPVRLDPPGPAPGWCVAQDPATVEVGPPDLASLLSATKCPVAMAVGEHDPLVAPGHHADLASAAAANPHTAGVTTPHVLDGLGHNAMVEDPQAVTDWLTALARSADTS